MDEHRIGLKPIARRIWAPRGQRPIALGQHRYEWLYVTAFAAPATGESHWYVGNGVSKPFFARLLALFARKAGLGERRTAILLLDGAGWHTRPGLRIPDGLRLVYLPPYTPPNCSRPSASGASSTSPSSTDTSTPSPTSKTASRHAAATSKPIQTPSGRRAIQ